MKEIKINFSRFFVIYFALLFRALSAAKMSFKPFHIFNVKVNRFL